MSAFVRACIALLKNGRLKIKNGNRFKCSLLNTYSASTEIKIHRGGQMSLGEHISALNDVTISVASGAELSIGKHVNFNKSCSVIAKERVEIGDYVIFGPNCSVYDHDHDYQYTGRERQEKFVTKSVKIGNGVWFGANCVVLKGTTIGDNCVFGAGCIIKGEYPESTLVVQKRENVLKKI